MNRGIEVLQTFALPLGYGTVFNFDYYDIITDNLRFVKGFFKIYRNYFSNCRKRGLCGRIQSPIFGVFGWLTVLFCEFQYTVDADHSHNGGDEYTEVNEEHNVGCGIAVVYDPAYAVRHAP